MDICYDFFFNWQTEKKNCFGQKFVFFINCSTEKNTWKKNGCKKLVKKIGENIWWLRYMLPASHDEAKYGGNDTLCWCVCFGRDICYGMLH